jgi:N-hydroxyarylamine O-acetyltransferase
MDDTAIAKYLERIGADRPGRIDIDALRYLQERHVMSVPFENLDYHLERPIHLDEQVLDKIVNERRGGGCYENNPAFALLLRALGFPVEIRPGRVHLPDGPGPLLCHLVLKVHLERTWLVDVGFGRNSRFPLSLDSRVAQPDPHGEYLLVTTDESGIDVLLDGKPLYRVEDRPVTMDDFRPTLWWYRTCAESPFLQDLFCSMPTPDGRVTLRGRRLTRIVGESRHVEELTGDAAVLDAYRKFFGIVLKRLPADPVRAPGMVGVRVG